MIQNFAGFSQCASQPKTDALVFIMIIVAIIAVVFISIQKFENVKYKLLLKVVLIISVLLYILVTTAIVSIPLTDFAPCN